MSSCLPGRRCRYLTVWSAGAPPRPPVSDAPSADVGCSVRRAYPETAAPWGVPPPGWDGSSRPAPSSDSSIARAGDYSGDLALRIASLEHWACRMVSSAAFTTSHHRPHPRRRSPAQQISGAGVCATDQLRRDGASLTQARARNDQRFGGGAQRCLALYSGAAYLLGASAARREGRRPAELRDAVRSLTPTLYQSLQ